VGLAAPPSANVSSNGWERIAELLEVPVKLEVDSDERLDSGFAGGSQGEYAKLQ
jgi:hypothetical protein